MFCCIGKQNIILHPECSVFLRKTPVVMPAKRPPSLSSRKGPLILLLQQFHVSVFVHGKRFILAMFAFLAFAIPRNGAYLLICFQGMAAPGTAIITIFGQLRAFANTKINLIAVRFVDSPHNTDGPVPCFAMMVFHFELRGKFPIRIASPDTLLIYPVCLFFELSIVRCPVFQLRLWVLAASLKASQNKKQHSSTSHAGHRA
mmetsp:Transcript_36408/g.67781  ORF Transcript_36408/g.67781 Transcript_36408/m.67781 type:complete len:202 (-) Transcript_36408:22-627(-)